MKRTVYLTVSILLLALGFLNGAVHSEPAKVELYLCKGGTLNSGKLVPGTLFFGKQVIAWNDLEPKLKEAGVARGSLIVIHIDVEATPDLIQHVHSVLDRQAYTNIEIRTRGTWLLEKLKK